MRQLYFSAVAANTKVAPALLRQTENTLRPFKGYLRRAARTAMERQSRYELPWQVVGDQQVLGWTAVDHQLWVPSRERGWRISGWPANAVPDTRHQLMVVNRNLTVDVLSCVQDVEGLTLQIDGDVEPEDQVFWGGHACSLVREPAPAPPVSVSAVDGSSLTLRRTPRAEDEGWLLVIEGPDQARERLVIDGELVAPRALPAERGLSRLRDGDGRSFEFSSGLLKVDDLPAVGLLEGDNGIRLRWTSGRTDRRARWVRLLLPETHDAEDFLDPRAAFCEGDVKEVWTQPRHDRTGKAIYKVLRVDSDRYQLLLDRLPPAGQTLFLPVNVHTLHLQQRALRQLQLEPLPHHAGLLRLCEDPAQVRWPHFEAQAPLRWAELSDETRSGTGEQRSFVGKALGTRDIAILEGPPGSGKTTAICELIRKLVDEGQRVLLCASTHVAIDNVLERLLDAGAPIDAVRVGAADRVDEHVQATQIDRKVDALLEAWGTAPHLRDIPGDDLRKMAVRVVIASANLTCGTTAGIAQHPLFQDPDRDVKRQERPIATMAHWDVLIVDEASKTTTQEFLVPALMAKRHVIVGDVRQLPPFADRDDIVANLRSLTDGKRTELFPAERQRASLLLFRLNRAQLRSAAARWLIVEPPGVVEALAEEAAAQTDLELTMTRVVTRISERPTGCVEVSIDQVRSGHPAALRLLMSDWVLVSDDLIAEIGDRIPPDLLHHRDLDLGRGARGLAETHPLRFRHGWWLERARPLARRYRERREEVATPAAAEGHEQRWLAQHDFANELAWRLLRIHELKHTRNPDDRTRLKRDVARLLPAAVDISEAVAEIEDIGLPSVLEVLQEGIGAQRKQRPSALTEGMRPRTPEAFDARFGSLSYQHRMHAEISDFPREVIYTGSSLLDANTIADRDRQVAWSFGPFARRRVWIDPHGSESGGVNDKEVRVAEGIVRAFLAWAEQAGPPPRSSATWEVACLCFYLKQEQALSKMLQRVTGSQRKTRFRVGGVELVCGTVDRFQGREADLVILSMRNTGRVGFLDSRNRLNVAVTRARQQLVVVGNARYFGHCRVAELNELVRLSPREEAGPWMSARR